MSYLVAPNVWKGIYIKRAMLLQNAENKKCLVYATFHLKLKACIYKMLVTQKRTEM